MNAKITVIVEDFRHSHATRQNGALLQSPISPKRLPGNRVLVRQDQGERKNEVALMKPEDLVKLDSGPRSAYAHGIIIRSHREQGYRKGDAVWLRELASLYRDGSVHRRAHITAYNLRTWEPITVALGDVCWIPKYRKPDCGGDEEELLTISGPLVKKYDRRTYYLAVVQRLYSRNSVVEAKRVEMRELVEQETWGYQNLTALPDGERRIGELFHRCLVSVAPDVLSEADLDEENASQTSVVPLGTGMSSDRAVTPTPSTPDGISEQESTDVSIDLSLIDGEEDPDVVRRFLDLERRVMAKKAGEPKSLVPAGPPPQGICNLHDRCPTPPKIFIQANMPTLENPYPRHHHLEDHRCPIGAAHELHCVFQFRRDGNDRDGGGGGGGDTVDRRYCIIPPTVRHTCCETNARPRNKRILPPPSTIDVGGDEVIRRGGRGTLYVVSEREPDYSDLPVEVRGVAFVPARDLDERGRRLFGYREEVEMTEREGVPGRGEDDWLNGCGRDGDGCRAEVCTRQMLPGHGLGVPVPCVPGLGTSSSFSPMCGPRDIQTAFDAVGSASMPIVLDDSSGNDGLEEEEGEEGRKQAGEEEGPEAFGDRHFHGEDDFDDFDDSHVHAAGDVFGEEMVTAIY